MKWDEIRKQADELQERINMLKNNCDAADIGCRIVTTGAITGYSRTPHYVVEITYTPQNDSKKIED